MRTITMTCPTIAVRLLQNIIHDRSTEAVCCDVYESLMKNDAKNPNFWGIWIAPIERMEADELRQLTMPVATRSV